MTFNQLFLQFQKDYGANHDIIFFEIVFAISKTVKNKEVFVKYRDELIDFKIKKFYKMCNDYFKKEKPLAHVTGYTTFLGLRFKVSRKVLAPRDVTEQMVADFVAKYKDRDYLKVLDLCCGCGCIGISIKKLCPQFDVTCVDKYWKPIFDTNANGITHKTRLTIDVKDACDYLDHLGSVDILISNPPYINASNFKNNKMFKWESKKALIAPDNGLHFYKKYFAWLHKHKFLEAWLEYGYDLVEALKQELAKYPDLEYEFVKDRQYLIIKNK